MIEFTLLWQLEMRNRDHRITFFLEDVIKAINGSHFCEPVFQRTPGRLAVGRPVSQRLKNVIWIGSVFWPYFWCRNRQHPGVSPPHRCGMAMM
ncbi:MAG: hypothetical protein PUI29_00560 [Aeromonadales bacterium]|nr:hypothetical protein [Aeromonadales bacterium]MDY2891220.1 hypothetical protein [Succinivibrio sp.]